MKIANISTIKNQLSRYLNYVRRGERVRIMDRDRPVADLMPVEPGSADTPAEAKVLLKELEARGIVRVGSGRLPKEVFIRPAKIFPDTVETGILEALLEDRKAGR